MKFNATVDQVKQIAAHAINASQPMGLGLLHYSPKEYGPSDIGNDSFQRDGSLYFDYFQGRMVKLSIRHLGENSWEINDNISSDYQSWASKYTVKQLVESVISVAA